MTEIVENDTNTLPTEIAHIETIPLSEVEAWLQFHIKPYLERIEKLEQTERRKDSQIHSLRLALDQLKTLLTSTKLPHKITPATPVPNGKAPKPVVTATTEPKEDKKVVKKEPKPNGTDNKLPTDAPKVTRPQTAGPKKDEDDKKVPLAPLKPKVKKDETKTDEKPEDKKNEKKPVRPTTAVADKKNPVTSTPKTTVKKDDPKVKKDKESPASVDDKKVASTAHKNPAGHKAPVTKTEVKKGEKKDATKHSDKETVEETKHDEVAPTEEQPSASVVQEEQSQEKAPEETIKQEENPQPSEEKNEEATESALPVLQEIIHTDPVAVEPQHEEESI